MNGALTDLHSITMALCALILLLGFAAILCSALLHHRRGVEKQSNFHRTATAEVCWALVPCLMVAVLVWPVARGVLPL